MDENQTIRNEGFWRDPGEHDKNTNICLTRPAGLCKCTAPTLH